MIDFRHQRLLVIAPHPDDEVIGCGGLIRKIKNYGGKVYVLFLTVGDTEDFSEKGLSTEDERKTEIEIVSQFLKIDNCHLAFAGNNNHLKLDTVGQKALMDMIERKSIVSIEKVKPTMIAFPSSLSYNQDHRIVALATHAALRPTSGKNKHLVDMVLSYEEAADKWTLHNQPEPNLFIKLTKAELDAKIKALSLYISQLRFTPSLRATKTLRALAVLRGAQSGSHLAEGYNSYRIIT